jgi:hypothetical protein
VDSEPQL